MLLSQNTGRGLVAVALLAGAVVLGLFLRPDPPQRVTVKTRLPRKIGPDFQPRKEIDSSALEQVLLAMPPWPATAGLEEIRQSFVQAVPLAWKKLDSVKSRSNYDQVDWFLKRAALHCHEGKPSAAYEELREARRVAAKDPFTHEEWLYSIIYFQGITGLRRGEDDNCIACRGDSSCIIPIVPAAVHRHPAGSRLAIEHFTEYLNRFPDDLGVRWLLNLAHMTLGEYPTQVDPRYLLSLDPFFKSEFNIGRFRDIGRQVGVNRLNQAGGAIMDDFDGDGLLDIVITSWDPAVSMQYFRNKGDGTFENRTQPAGLEQQLGGLYCVQTDYNNDGHLDIFICRGAWLTLPMRPSLLRNNGDGTFTDVTEKAGLLDPVNSISASWADFDNDGHLDLFICCDWQANRLYHNQGNGTFRDVAHQAGVAGKAQISKGAAWIDFDNDRFPDLLVNNIHGTPQLYRNNRKGEFTDVTQTMGIQAPRFGFSCWAFDYDNDGWLDLFATSYFRTLDDLVKSMTGAPTTAATSKLYRNLGEGKGFDDVTRRAGLDKVFAAMGSNFADFDNDGFLDFYLGTGDPNLSTLRPNRLFKNVAGKRFADISASSGTAHLQKGHGVACGDWDRDGNVDIFIEMGGAIPGEMYHNILFHNPGQGNNSLTVKLIGVKTNRAAIGARLKLVTAGPEPLTIHRHISTGSSFGANALEQTIGVGKADKIALLEIHWPTSDTTQTFRDLAPNQAIEITEFAAAYRKLSPKRVPVPK